MGNRSHYGRASWWQHWACRFLPQPILVCTAPAQQRGCQCPLRQGAVRRGDFAGPAGLKCPQERLGVPFCALLIWLWLCPFTGLCFVNQRLPYGRAAPWSVLHGHSEWMCPLQQCCDSVLFSLDRLWQGTRGDSSACWSSRRASLQVGICLLCLPAGSGLHNIPSPLSLSLWVGGSGLGCS